MKSIAEYSIGPMNKWLAKGETPNENWRCFDCQHPACKQCLDEGRTNIPLFAVPHNAFINGHYYCDDCRYPLCRNCRINRRPNPRSDARFDKNFTCA
eukprot:6718812-Karenia_brevis.AAC.1